MKALGWDCSWHPQAFIGKADNSSFLFNSVSPIKNAEPKALLLWCFACSPTQNRGKPEKGV